MSGCLGRLACAVGWHAWDNLGMDLFCNPYWVCRRCGRVEGLLITAGGLTVHRQRDPALRAVVKERRGG